MSAYIDCELPVEQAEQVRAHLQGCPRCQAYAAELGQTWALLGLDAEIDPQADFTDRVLRRVRTQQPDHVAAGRTEPRPNVLPRLALAAAVVLCIVVGGLLGAADAGLLSAAEPAQLVQAEALTDYLGLEVFSDLPPDSVGGAYLQLAYQGQAEGR